MVRPRRAIQCGTFFAALIAGGSPPALASHGGALMGVVIHFKGMQSVAAPAGSPGCAVSGAVENGSDRQVTVRISYRGRDADGTIALAGVRLARVQPRETREFVSSAFQGLLADALPSAESR